MRFFVVTIVVTFYLQLQFFATTILGQSVVYGPSDDASWAIHSPRPSTLLSADKPEIYERYIRQCDQTADEEHRRRGLPSDPHFCTYNDKFRMQMNREQPSSVYNYTQLGYQKIRTPSHLFELIQNFYQLNKHEATIEWSEVNTYQNMWEYPSTMVRMENASLVGGGLDLFNQVTMEAQKVLEEWVRQPLTPVSLYGVREYHRGSLLAPHVDRMPLIISAIINVDQIGMDEPWVLEVYGHDGKATNVTMEVGDMVLYESHSVIHGRPFPLLGDVYANVFVHFEPTDTSSYDPKIGLPPYVIAGSKWEKVWRQEHPTGWLQDGNFDIHDQDKLQEEDEGEEDEEDDRDELVAIQAVWQGDVERLRVIGQEDPKALHQPDKNGWHALHEAVRLGKMDMVQLLLEYGANVNQVTDYEQTPLSLAIRYQGKDHHMTTFLLEQGAVDSTPEL